MPDINGVDDYLHQAADSANWPKELFMIRITAENLYQVWVFMNIGIIL